jgi:hypothetical protein
MHSKILGKILAAAMAGALGGCAAQSGQNSPDQLISAIGTPFYVAFKIPTCVATVLIAAPTAGATGLAEGYDAREVRHDLGEGVAYNCGPPWILTP